jgi:hypothetical protein
MTKLEELKAAYSAAWAAALAVHAGYNTYCAVDAFGARVAACVSANDAYWAARDAYEAELKKTQEENSNDDESYCSIIPRGC